MQNSSWRSLNFLLCGKKHAEQWHACAAAVVRLEMAASKASGNRPVHVFSSFCRDARDWGAACQTQMKTCIATAGDPQYITASGLEGSNAADAMSTR